MKIKSLLSLVLLLTFFACGETGKEFDTYGDFMKYQEEEGFIFLGRFDDVWPAVITDVEFANDEISFVRPDGTPNTYSGYDGYELKVVKLDSEKWNRKFVIVLRSKDKADKEKDVY